MKLRKLPILFMFILLIVQANSMRAQIQKPEDFVGFKVGTDKMLFGWEKVVEYFWMLDSKSDRVTVQELGQSTLGKPFIMAIISAPNNLLNLAKYKNLQKQAANPRHLSEQDMKLLAEQNKAVVMVTLNIHSTEIASSQESIELAYLLATGQTRQIQRILENVIILLIPSLNPDGMQKVVDWYNQYVDTPHEGSPLPFLYHPYAGHDNNRDWFMMNLVETKLVSRQYYHEWFPVLVYDQHQMGSSSARLFLPPYADPVNPNLHPLLLTQMNKIGKHIVSDLQVQGFQGIVTDAFYTAWWEGTSVMTPWWHNMMGILSETASALSATPLYFPEGSLRAGRRGLPEYNQRMNFLDPWPGGWWRLRDIIDYELAITFSLLDVTARDKESIIYNFCKMNKEAIARGETEPPFAFVMPAEQHDPVTAVKMLEILLEGGVEVQQAEEDFRVGHLGFNKGDYVILLAQPFRPYVKDLLERQDYPELRDYPGGPPIRPYDVTGWTLPLMMGVNTIRVDEPFSAKLSQVKLVKPPRQNLVRQSGGDYLISHEANRSFIAVNRLLNEGKKVFWLKQAVEMDGKTVPPGLIYLPFKEINENKMDFLAQEMAIEIRQSTANFGGREAYRLKEIKLGLYQPWTANMDEGWTRFLLEEFEFPFKSVYNSKIRGGNLYGEFNVIILPDMPMKQIINGRKEEKPNMYRPEVPKSYQDGITDEGVEALNEFVTKGGTLIALDSASELPIEKFGLPVENVLKDVKNTDFFCPGTLLEMIVDNTEPVAYGMPQKAAGMFVNSPAFRPIYWTRPTKVVAHYPGHNPLLSGWILGAEKIEGLSSVLDIPMGQGRVILIGFRAQNRAQTPGTYKLLFNAIHLGNSEEVVIKED